jgi:hypothetical protein
MSKTEAWLRLGALAVVLAGLITAGALLAAHVDDRPATVAIYAILAFILALTALTGAFYALGLSQSKQALGLPPGSVRAILAILFVGIFVGLSIYLLNQVTPSKTQSSFNGVPLATVTQLGGTITKISPDKGSKPLTYSGLIASQDTSRKDLALQIFTASSTLVASVSAYYFGAKTATAAKPKDSGTGTTETPVAVTQPANDPYDLPHQAGGWPPLPIHVVGGGAGGLTATVTPANAGKIVSGAAGTYTFTITDPPQPGTVAVTFASVGQPSNQAVLKIVPGA